MKIDICSRKVAEALLENGFPENTAVISFYDPPSKRMKDVLPPVDYKGKADRVFYVQVHDIDVEILPDYGLTVDTYLPEADRLADFIRKAYDDGLDILCQCEYGQSRSAACAAAIAEFYYHNGIEIFADSRYSPNQLVYHKIIDALCKGEYRAVSLHPNSHNKPGG